MRCLHLTLTTTRGGRRDAILTLIGQLRHLGVTCGLVGLRDTSDQVASLAGQVDFSVGLGLTGRPTVAAIVTLWRLCRTKGIDVLHVHDAGSQTVASLLRLLLPSLHVVMTFHRTLGFDSEGPRNHLRNRLTLPFVSKVITASTERKQYFVKETAMPEGRVIVIPHGTELSTFHPDTTRRAWARTELGIAPDAVLLVAVGHFGREKGIDLVLAAATSARARVGSIPFHLAVLGEGTAAQEEALRAASDALGDDVTFLGFRSDVSAWLQGADILVHTPRLEAFGLVTIQAMACGVPVVASRVGGLPEIVEHERTGLLVPAEDAHATGVALAELIGDPPRRAALGAAGRTVAVAQYDAAACARQHLAIYTSLH